MQIQYTMIDITKMMRNHKIHHLFVTHEKKLVGVISSFDLIELVEKNKFVAKNSSQPNKRGKRSTAEDSI